MKKQKTGSVSNKREAKPECQFGFVRIELIDHFVSDQHQLEIGDSIKFNLAIDLKADYNKSFLLIKVRCAFSLLDGTEIMYLIVENEFEIKSLRQHVVNKKFVNKTFIQFLAELSLNHTRGLQGNMINNTNLYRLFIPPADLSQVKNDIIE
jgi:hypothetical protein